MLHKINARIWGEWVVASGAAISTTALPESKLQIHRIGSIVFLAITQRKSLCSMGVTAGVLLCGLALPTALHAASFDCGRAKTPAENFICGNAELSAMDEKLAEAYKTAQKESANPEALKHRQQTWLKELQKYCKTVNCLEGAYWARTRALEDGQGAKVYDVTGLNTEREANKAPKAKAMLAQNPLSLYVGIKGKQRNFCNGFYEALRTASPKIIYIEPVFRTNDPTHPALGEYLACSLYEPRSPDIFEMSLFGSRGFRLYRADMDGNPKNGLEEYLYGQEPEVYGSTSNNLAASYTSVDRTSCKKRDSVGFSAENPLDDRFIDSNGVNAMVLYQGRYYVYDLGRGSTYSQSGSLWSYDSKKRVFRSSPKMQCIW